MIIKKKDSIDKNLKQLESLAQLSDLPQEKIANIKKEIKLLTSGNKGEQDSAYFIDFYYKESPNWAVIHDLRINHGGFVAQIDHLLINRVLDFYVLETKQFSHGIKVTERGEFLVYFQKHYVSIESPVEQNKRHIKVLKNLLRDKELLPKRLGFSLQPHFLSYILVSPKSRVIRPKKQDFNTDMLIKADEFYQQTRDNLNNENPIATLGSVAKIISRESLKDIAEQLVGYHQPIEIDYYSKLGISKIKNNALPKPNIKQEEESSKYYCYNCKKSISKKVAMFCFSSKNRFDGKAYCYDCQKSFTSK